MFFIFVFNSGVKEVFKYRTFLLPILMLYASFSAFISWRPDSSVGRAFGFSLARYLSCAGSNPAGNASKIISISEKISIFSCSGTCLYQMV